MKRGGEGDKAGLLALLLQSPHLQKDVDNARHEVRAVGLCRDCEGMRPAHQALGSQLLRLQLGLAPLSLCFRLR
jgi:hypothetical protein